MPPGVSVQRNYYLTCRAAGRLMPRVLAGLESGSLKSVGQDPDAGAYWRWPDSAAFDRLRERGHSLVSWGQLVRLLAGADDDHRALEGLGAEVAGALARADAGAPERPLPGG